MPRRIAIIGSGPAGFYTAQKLLPTYNVDMFEQLPAPFGLVRYGVSPLHSSVKNVINKFRATANHSNFNYFGNYTADLSLLKSYNSIVWCTGSQCDRKLNIPDNCSISSRDFVGWYNGHPYATLDPHLGNTVLILGNGNVALDVAAILLSPWDYLSTTDISTRALLALKAASVDRVIIAGRRGPIQSSFTTKELREIVGLPNLNFTLDTALIESEISSNWDFLAQNRAKRRIMDILKLQQPNPIYQKTLEFQYLSSPVSIDQESLGNIKVTFEKNKMVGQMPNAQMVSTNEQFVVKCSAVIQCLGYESQAVPGLEFDSRNSRIPNNKGRVLDPMGNHIKGVYVAGWLKSGPQGVIASTMHDAFETADSIISDLQSDSCPDKPGINPPNTISFKQWEKIDSIEKELGLAQNRPREKIVSIEHMLKIARLD
jgi:adrenodoxin-NADP+ reductase